MVSFFLNIDMWWIIYKYSRWDIVLSHQQPPFHFPISKETLKRKMKGTLPKFWLLIYPSLLTDSTAYYCLKELIGQSLLIPFYSFVSIYCPVFKILISIFFLFQLGFTDSLIDLISLSSIFFMIEANNFQYYWLGCIF